MSSTTLFDRIGLRKIPEISYIILTTARSGSTLLCNLLEKTGVAGRPGEHFLDWYRTECRPELIQPMEAPFRMLPPALQFRRVFKRGTAHNVFAVKVMLSYFPFIENSLKRVGDMHDLSTKEMLEACFPNLHYIYLARKNKIRQAVSLSRAVQSDEWKRNRWTLLANAFKSVQVPQKKNTELLYDFDTIHGFYQEIIRQEQEWENVFQVTGIDPYRVSYENLINDMENTIVSILKYLGAAVPQELNLSHIDLKRQSDTLNEEWLLRFERELARYSDLNRSI
jgi:LPS sulfotransferase NodH